MTPRRVTSVAQMQDAAEYCDEGHSIGGRVSRCRQAPWHAAHKVPSHARCSRSGIIYCSACLGMICMSCPPKVLVLGQGGASFASSPLRLLLTCRYVIYLQGTSWVSAARATKPLTAGVTSWPSGSPLHHLKLRPEEPLPLCFQKLTTRPSAACIRLDKPWSRRMPSFFAESGSK